jgi:CDGSH-type Zn-finger protein
MEDKTVFKITPGGPVHVKGNFQIKGSDGEILKVVEEAYLCRCGGSKNKPFCDDTHKKNGFHD